jgi:hypothetical protein
MSKHRILKSVLHNFLVTYTSRYSDFQGYWLLGFLVEDIQYTRIDLLDTSFNIDDTPMAVAKRLAVRKFAEQIDKVNISRSNIRSAYLEITKLPAPKDRFAFYDGHFNSPSELQFVARSVTHSGKLYERTESIIVDPHNPGLETRSGRLSCVICHDTLQAGAAFCHNCGTQISNQVIRKGITLISPYPNVSWHEDKFHLRIDASSPEGFPIVVTSSGTETILQFGNWHDHFADPLEAADLLQKAFTGNVRLVEVSRCGISYRWNVQVLESTGEWNTRFINALLIPIPLPRKRTQYYINHFYPIT